MNKKLILFLSLFNPFILLFSNAQWDEHYQWTSCSFSGFYNDTPFAGHSLGLYAKEDNTINKISKATILSDSGISAVLSNDTYIYIGYSNGNIDIINMSDGSTTNIPELKTNELIQDKTINSLFLHNNTLYCASNSGIFVIDLPKQEIKTLYKVSQTNAKINAITIANDSLYAATANGLFVASLKNNLLEDHNNWNLSHDIDTVCSDITTFDSKVFVALGNKDKKNIITIISSNSAPSNLTSSSAFRGFSTNADALAIVNSNNIKIYDKSLKNIASVTSYKFSDSSKTPNIRSAVLKNNSFAIADGKLGLVTCDINGNNASSTSLNGPTNNNSFKVFATEKAVYILGGGINNEYNNKNITPTLHIYSENKWTTSTAKGKDLINICNDPNNPDSIYASLWGSGIYKIENQKFSTNYHAYNSALVDIFEGNSYVRVNAITYDNHSNLIVTNAGVKPGLWIKTQQNDWYPLSYIPTDICHSTKDMIHTRNNNSWLIISPMSNQYGGLFVFNTNGTIEDDSDDMYRAKSTVTSESRNYGDLKLIDSNGETLASLVNAVAEDKNGTIWIGTEVGIIVFYDDASIFDTPQPVFHRIKVPRNDGTNNADYLLDGVDVTAITVDGANNKWIGTKTEGIFLVDETGINTLEHFNTKNSPLPTNEISSISIHPTTGEVFIATPLGTLSYKNYVNESSNSLSDIKVYPNPIRPEYDNVIRVKGFTHDCSVKITDIAGRLVYETKSQGGTAIWNKETVSGLRLKSGVYLVWATDKEGKESVVSKILLMK